MLQDPLPNAELPADLEHAVGRNDVVAGSWLELTELLYSGSWQPRLRRLRNRRVEALSSERPQRCPV